MECKCKTAYRSTIQELVVNLRSNIHSAIQDYLNSKVIKICPKCKQNKSHKLMQRLSSRLKIIMININRFDKNNRKLNNVICISELMNINRYQVIHSKLKHLSKWAVHICY